MSAAARPRHRHPPAGTSAPAAPEVPWYKDAIIYELSVPAFFDSDGDGTGDLPGLTSRLDYLQGLGVTALWLQPFYASPWRDGGYDVADHCAVHPACGTLDDFRRFLEEAHRRDLRVVTELVLNHTSDQHPWFQRARRAPPGSSERAFYVWSDRADRYPEARVLFNDREASNWTWDPAAAAYYWHRFYAHEPDLNFDSADAREAVARALDFWLDLGVDGLRLDAVSFLYEREGTTCEDLPETHEFLRALRRRVDERFPGRILLAEADLWPEDAATYFGGGDEAHLVFHTPLVPRMFTALHMEDRHPILDVLAQTPEIPPRSQWVLFLRNHDELTLEMVTDEERELMYRAYAAEPEARLRQGIRRRLSPLLGQDRRRTELLYGLLLSLPGTPAVYYGDEIGMGDNVYLRDRQGVRTPMQWSAGANAGFSEANPQRLYIPPVADSMYSYAACNVAAQDANPRSLLWWMRGIFAQRRRLPALGRGALRPVRCSSRAVLAFVRELGEERVLVVANLSGHVEPVRLDLSAWRGLTPVEVSGRTAFPAVGEGEYALTVGGHVFYWFALDPPPAQASGMERRGGAAVEPAGGLPRLAVPGAWDSILRGRGDDALTAALPAFLASRRWFAGKARRIRSVEVVDAAPLPFASEVGWITLLRVSYAEGEAETYALPLAFASGEEAGRVRHEHASALIAELSSGGTPGLLYAAEGDPRLQRALLDAIGEGRRLPGSEGEMAASATSAFASRRVAADDRPPALLRGEQSNTSIRYGDAFILKLFRKVEPGINPDLEVGAFLTERAGYAHSPPVCGWLEYRPHRGPRTALAILQGYVPNEGDAWRFTLDAVGRFLGELMSRPDWREPAPPPPRGMLDRVAAPVPEPARALMGASLEGAALLGRRTAELHRALASDQEDPAFSPEPFTRLDRRALYQSLRNQAEDSFDLLRRRLGQVPEEARPLAGRVLAGHDALLGRFRMLADRPLRALRTRTHGDYHLGQVLWTGRDFVIIDFEGEPARPASIRRAKRSPLRDVAGMLRSYHYAAYQGLATLQEGGAIERGAAAVAESWAAFWYAWVAAGFLRGYLQVARGAPFLPERDDELDDLLVLHLLEKAVYELAYELNNRPAWVRLPLLGIAALLAGE